MGTGRHGKSAVATMTWLPVSMSRSSEQEAAASRKARIGYRRPRTAFAWLLTAVAASQALLAAAPGHAQVKCTDYKLGPGREKAVLDGITFMIMTEDASKPVVLGCRPRTLSVRAADGTPGAASCAQLERSSKFPAGRAPVFLGDANFIYDTTTVRVCY
jgi:hypothetical protein